MTVKVYAVPEVRPVTVSGDEEPVAVKPPGLEVAVYVTVPLPVYEDGVNATLTD